MLVDTSKPVDFYDFRLDKSFSIILDARNPEEEGKFLAEILKKGIDERKVVSEIPREFLDK